MKQFVNILTAVFDRPQSWAWSKEKDSRNIYDLIEVLLGSSGEVSGVTLARKILDRYLVLNNEEKLEFFNYLSLELDIKPYSIRKTLAEYEINKTMNQRLIIFAGF